MMKKLLAILLALAMLLSVSAVFAEGETADAAEPVVEATPVPDTLLVTVNGQEIHENNEKLQEYLSDLAAQFDPSDKNAARAAGMIALNYLLQEAMFRERIDANGPINEEELRKTAKEDWNSLIEQAMTIIAGINEDSSEEDRTAARADALSYMETNYGYTEETYIKAVVEGQPLNDAYTAILEELKSSQPDLTVTDDEIQNEVNDLAKQDQEQIGFMVYADKMTSDNPEMADAPDYDALSKAFDELTPEEKKVYYNDLDAYEYYKSIYNSYGYKVYYVPEGYRGVIHILLDVDQELLNKWTDLNARYEESLEPKEDVESSEDTKETEEPTETPSETSEPVTAEMVEAARQAVLDSKKAIIDEIQEKIDAGTAFEDLIAEYCTDPGMRDESNLLNGYFVRPDSNPYDKNFYDAALSLEKVGDVSEPIVSQLGIHILKYLQDVPAGAVKLSSDEIEELRASMEEERLSLAYSEYFDSWLSSSDVVWTAEGESWKYDQDFIDKVQAGAFEEDESGEEAPEAEPAAETAAEPAADTEATPAP